VSNWLVTTARQSLLETNSDPAPTTRTYTDKHGNVSEMNVENIGKRRKREPVKIPEVYNQPGMPEPNYYNVSLPVKSVDSAAIILCELCSDSYLRQLIEFIERHLEGDNSWQ